MVALERPSSRQHHLRDTDPAMLAWTRLPTPMPDAEQVPVASSDAVPPSPTKPFMKSLSIRTAGVSDGLLPSPLPSPPDVSSSGSSKTAAFFGSPFVAPGPPTPTPPPPPSRNETLTALSRSNESRSATSDFFFAGAPGTRPTPPPSIKSSAGSRETSPPRLPPLSRFFPSRHAKYPTVEGQDDDHLNHRRKDVDWEASFKREFLKLSEESSPLPPSPPLTTSSAISPPVEHRPLPLLHTSHRGVHNVPIRRETHLVGASREASALGLEAPISGPTAMPTAGTHLESSSVKLTLVRTLGEGAFSSVWLATDDAGTLVSKGLSQSQSRSETLRRKSSNWAKKGRDKRMQGIKPPTTVSTSVLGKEFVEAENADGSLVLDEQDGEGAIAAPENHTQTMRPTGKLVAVKMIDRALCDADDRTRISFVREVEVLRHIAHPSIIEYLHSFTSDTNHCLVLEYVAGRELFDLVNSNVRFARVTEASVRRMWGELCLAVGWMHGVGLVHRDIKLENILLTQDIFATNDPLPHPNIPFVKLTDFGLSRFIDPESPLLSTRCGSESYAAPELVLGARSKRSATSDSESSESSESKGYYDGRQTDAWACGVVLYALATRQLPFDTPPPVPASVSAAPSRAGSVRSTRSNRSTGSGSVRLRSVNPRRDMLMRIAQCEYYWPDEVQLSDDEDYSPFGEDGEEMDAQFAAAKRLASPGLKRIVRRLLERSSARRARMVDLWDEPWLHEEGAPAPPLCAMSAFTNDECDRPDDRNDEEWHSQDGILLDSEHISSIASQEL